MILRDKSFLLNKKSITYVLLTLLFSLITIISVHSQNSQSDDEYTAYLEVTEFETDIRQQETILTVSETGLYSIQAESPTGTRISVIDRMSGILSSSGSVGDYDGRIDVLLSEGEYKIKLFSDIYADGRISLSVFLYKELNSNINELPVRLNTLPGISDGEAIYTELNDLEQKSYWIYIKEDEALTLEIMGRNLSGSILWKDGIWLTPIVPSESIYETEPGKPMKYLEYHHDFTEGYYLLTCYGGEAEDWTGELDSLNNQPDIIDENPLYIRYGIPYIGENGMQDIIISPFGRDAYRISKNTNYFEVFRENFEETKIFLNRFSNSRSRFYNNRASAEITNQSENSYCTIEYSQGSYEHTLIIQANPGDICSLTFFKETGYYQFDHSSSVTKNFWVSSIDSIEGRNLIDISPIMYDPETKEVLQYNTPVIGTEKPYVRRINLLSESTVYINIEAAGTYKIVESEEYGAEGNYWFVLFEDAINGTFGEENFQLADGSFELTAGLYILSIKPVHSGILHFVIYNESTGFNDAADSHKLNALNNAKLLLEETAPDTVNYFTWPNVVIPARSRYEDEILIFLNPREQDDEIGLIVRELPIILDNPLPVFLPSGETVEIPIKIEDVSLLKIGGANPELEVRGGVNSDTIAMDDLNLYPGEYILTLTNNNPDTELFTVSAEKLETVEIPAPELKPLEEVFTFLTEEESIYLDFDYNEQKEFILRVGEPGFYRIETSGRLSMGLDIRTDLTESLFSERNNGIGRNALIQTYLKPGDYLILVKALGESAGRTGIHLNRTPMLDAGKLFVDSIARNTVELDNALRFTIDIEELGDFNINTYGLNKSFSFRLEDDDGWPVNLPIGTGSLNTELYPGTYYYYSLPEPLKTRRLTQLIWKIGYGMPHGLLIVNEPEITIWREKSEPDIFYFSLTAPIEATFFITEEMEARIFKEGEELYYLTGGEDTEIYLVDGDYEIRARSVEENNFYEYSIRLYTNYLIPGETKDINSDTITLSVAEESIVDIWSTGAYDKKASLWDETGTILLAENDDMENDWNFRISRKLEPGLYNLKVENAGVDSYVTSIVHMEIRNERIINAGSLPVAYSEMLNKDVLTFPFKTDNMKELIEIKCIADSEISIALYKEEKLIVKTEDTLYIPLDENSSYTLQFWHNENIDIPVGISAEIIKGLKVTELPYTKEQISLPLYSKFVNNTGLSYYFYAEDTELLYSPGIDRPCIPLKDFPVNTANNSGWIINANAEENKTLHIIPLVLSENETTALMLGDIEHSFYIDHTSGNVLLLEVESEGMLTGCMVFPDYNFNSNEVLWESMHIQYSETLSGLSSNGLYQGKLWNINSNIKTGDDTNKEQAEQRINLNLRGFELQEQIILEDTFTLQLEPGKACEINIGSRVQELNLLLAENVTAFSVNNYISESIVSASNRNIEKIITVSGGKILFVNRGTEPASFRIQRVGFPSEIILTVSSGNQYESIMESDGSIIFNIDTGRNRTGEYTLNHQGALNTGDGAYVLCVAGDNVDAVLYTENGNIYKGINCFYGNNYKELRPYLILPSMNGKLEVNYSGGYLKVWLSATDSIDTQFIEPSGNIRNGVLDDNIGELSDNSQKWLVEIIEPGFISIETNAPGITILMSGNEVISISAGIDGRKILAYVDAGNYKIITRPFSDSSQAGSIIVNNISINIIEDHIYFIGPFETQVFKFNVTRDTTVGIGLKAEMDSLKCTLYDNQFNLIAAGSIIFENLRVGEYFIVVESDEMPVQYKPLVHGADGSITEVPPDVIEEFK